MKQVTFDGSHADIRGLSLSRLIQPNAVGDCTTSAALSNAIDTFINGLYQFLKYDLLSRVGQHHFS
jgi:hypothetical protein